MSKENKSKYRRMVENDWEYKEMVKFRKNFDYSDIKETGWVLDYAQEKFKLMRDYVEYLDDKADAMLRYLGLGTGVLGYILGSSFTCFVPLSKIFIGLCVIFWIISILFALAIKQPYGMPYPPKTKVVFNYMKKYKEKNEVQARIALQFDETALGQKLIGLIKAKRLQWAYRLLVAALVVFLISFFINFI